MAIRRRYTKKSKVFSGIIAMIIVAISFIWFEGTQEPPVMTYGSNQNDDGYYYYTYVESNDYYDGANDLVGNALKQELHDIINTGIERTSYEEAKDYLANSDGSLTDDTKVYNIYDGVLAPRIWDSTSWHREHVWPNSRLGLDRVNESNRTIASDLHNLRAITPRVNSSRSDRIFSDGSGGYTTTEDGGFYPGDDHKGDVARIILYMAVMYDELMLTDDLDLLLDESDHYTPAGARMGQLSLLLRWHKEDPVDAFERARNQSIYEAQKNRNPFIDKPEYVHLIWEDMSINELLDPEDLGQSNSLFINMKKEYDYETYTI